MVNSIIKKIQGICEEWRISKKCRWTSNFTAPTKFGTTSTSASGGTIEWQNKTITSGSGSSYTIHCDGDFELGNKDFTIDFFVTFPEYNQFLTRRFLRRE